MKNALLLFWLLAFNLAASAQVISINVVGYYNLTIHPGQNLIASQLLQTNNTLDYILSGGVPAGSTLAKWDSGANQFLPVSTFDGANWSVNYSLTLGEGALLTSASRWTNLFVGEVGHYVPIGGTNIWQPNYGNGLHLLSDPIPRSGPMDVMFPNVTGRAPQEGESVQLLDAATQTYITTTFHTDTGWDNGNPTLGVGQAAWFNLGPSVVPEPGALTLMGLGAGALVMFGQRRRPHQTS